MDIRKTDEESLEHELDRLRAENARLESEVKRLREGLEQIIETHGGSYLGSCCICKIAKKALQQSA